MSNIDFTPADQIAKAVLYEGYLLYPYRRSSIKNQHRWMFGCLLPHSYCLDHADTDRSWMQTECLLQGDSPTCVQAKVHFLQQHGDEIVERELLTPLLHREELLAQTRKVAFHFPIPIEITNQIAASANIEGVVEMSMTWLQDDIYKLTVRISNMTSIDSPGNVSRDDALRLSLLSCHTALGLQKGAFISLMDPPHTQRSLAEQCHNIGTWPVLASRTDRCDLMLSSPIILYDHPHIAPESPGELYDNMEIDELLTLRILTLTDKEKQEMKYADARANAILQRAESLTADEMLRLHGKKGPDTLFEPGLRVRLKPRGGADAFDVLLRGKTGTISAVDRDYEGKIHISVTIDEDPGSDFGAEGLPGHRFFFGPDEVEFLKDHA